MGLDLTLIWFLIIIFGTWMYIIMDGFDLGIGILLPFAHNRQQKDMMVNTVAPVWDGNETWLVLGGAALFGAFPLAYAIILEALMMPLTLMLIALIFRGVAFEFRFKANPSHQALWDKAFVIGSMMATFCQGIVVGALVQGISVTNRQYTGGMFDWLSVFTLLCGFGLLAAYALLGATWLLLKTDGVLHQLAQNWSRYLLAALLIMMLCISVYTPLLNNSIAQRWFGQPQFWMFLPVPILCVLTAVVFIQAIKKQQDSLPFLCALILIFLGYSGLGISIWPNIIPPSIDIWQAASGLASQGFMALGTLLILPIVLAYTAWSYYVFRGKVKDSGYEH